VIGPEVKAKLFPNENPIGKHLKCGSVWLQVIGVLEGVIINENAEEMGISDYNRSVFTPIKTLLIRYKDRSLINQAALNSSNAFYFGGGSMMITDNEGSGVEANQLDKIVVQVKDSDQLASTALVLKKLMMRRHQGVEDFEIKIPELLLKQEQKTKDIFNIVLGAIAGISLIVGGIGIMNIMLASVMERIREIGVRRATGATKKDIVFQFLAEATFISITGGFIGILLGVIMAKVITATTDISTVVSFWSIVISFGVAASVGIIFGYLPAKKASEQDPVESLRHD
jgi:putative ABC transport system permease protein